MRLLFVDPASISTGWAYFVAGELRSSGTIAVNKLRNVFDRLTEIGKRYRATIVKGSVDETHIEQLVRNTHVFTHWSVGVIGAALSYVGPVSADVPISSWQKAVGWKTERKKGPGYVLKDESPLHEYKLRVGSADELAAIGMGIYWTRYRKEQQ